MTKTVIWTGKEKEISYEKKLENAGEDFKLLMLLVGRNEGNVKVNVEIEHVAENCSSQVVMKAILWDRAKVDFEGMLRINKGAKGTNTWLTANILLLSPQASGRAVPNLEISENEVKAGHGATVGKINEMEVYYLMSRGMEREKAKHLIVEGFLESMIRQFSKKEAMFARRHLQWKR